MATRLTPEERAARQSAAERAKAEAELEAAGGLAEVMAGRVATLKPVGDYGQDDAAHALEVAQAIGAIYADAEEALFQSLVDFLWDSASEAARAPSRKKRLEQIRSMSTKRGISPRRRAELLSELGKMSGADEKMVREYLERRSGEVAELRKEANRIIARLERRVFPMVAQAITDGWRRGVRRAIDDINQIGGKKAISAGVGVVEMARQMVKNLRVRHISALRTIDDVFQQVNRNVIGRVLAGAETIDKAIERELADYARRGVTEFVDRGGKRWTLEDYAEMAIHTSVIRANTDGHLNSLIANDLAFVIVTRSPFTCPRCAPFEGEILRADNGPTGEIEVTHYLTDEPMTIHVRATVEFARRVGFQHPRCGHTLGLYTPGVTEIPPQPPTKATYDDSQKQRRLERELRAAKRMAALSRTPAAQKAAREKSKKIQAELEQLAEEKGLRRNRGKESAGKLDPDQVAEAKQARIIASKALKSMRADIAAASAKNKSTARTPGGRSRTAGPPASSGGRPMDGPAAAGTGSPTSGGAGGGGADAPPATTLAERLQRRLDPTPEPQPSTDAPEARRDDDVSSRPEPRDERDEEDPGEGPGEERDDDPGGGGDDPTGAGGGQAKEPPTADRVSDYARGARSLLQRPKQGAAGDPAQVAKTWRQGLHDPADRSTWFTQAELDAAQLVEQPDLSFLVVVSGEVLGRVHRDQMRQVWRGEHATGEKAGQNAGRTRPRGTISRQQAVDQLMSEAHDRWRKSHPPQPQPRPPIAPATELAGKAQRAADAAATNLAAAERELELASAAFKKAEASADTSDPFAVDPAVQQARQRETAARKALDKAKRDKLLADSRAKSTAAQAGKITTAKGADSSQQRKPEGEDRAAQLAQAKAAHEQARKRMLEANAARIEADQEATRLAGEVFGAERAVEQALDEGVPEAEVAARRRTVRQARSAATAARQRAEDLRESAQDAGRAASAARRAYDTARARLGRAGNDELDRDEARRDRDDDRHDNDSKWG